MDFALPAAPAAPDDSYGGFYLRPRYRSTRPLDAMLGKVEPGNDPFISEKYADQLATILAEWSASLLRSARDTQAIARCLAPNFGAASLLPAESRVIRSSLGLRVQQNHFSDQYTLSAESFLPQWQSVLGVFSRILTAEFQITHLDARASPSTTPTQLETHIRYELVGTGAGFHREHRVGNWHVIWEPAAPGPFRISHWRVLDETQARSDSPVYTDIAAAALGSNSSFAAQLQHGTDYWRTVLDGASGIDIYGHNGVSVADIDNDGFDDLYVCQPAGLPNRLFRNRGDGTFEDITESSGFGILDNTACALFADFNNDGQQDVILVRANGPLLFLNQGGGKFRQKPDAFQFANPPQGTFTGAAVADYDRDGWLDVYFCLYSYYQGTGQYRYPSPYHDAENGPPNFLMRNHRDGTFGDVTAQAGLNQNNTRYSFCCGWNDYNHDGWPDLYVVNDFGRKNLYRNNGDGTFTDLASAAGAEDVGAGMSVTWFDYMNDGADDLYVGNMWTAAGLRVSNQEIFKSDSPPQIRALYRKHAMGNSLLRNRGAGFEETTTTAGVGMGRWAWSSDAFDFDHDGFLDLYIANGMVTGPSRSDLNSFFWRQVVANSPDHAGSSHEYEQGWNAVNELIRADQTWSGYERNVCYANNRDGTFSDVSAALGLDFVQDGRSFALADFDHDGRLEIFLKNRNAPQLRVLKNGMNRLPPAVSFRLQGTKSNRDAIGASVTIETSVGRQTRTLRAGSGFLSQHSKDVFFGLGEAKGSVRASILWPSGAVQELHDLPLNCRIWVTEGAPPSRLEPFGQIIRHDRAEATAEIEALPAQVETWLLAPVPAPDFSLPDQSGRTRSASENRGKPLLLHFWTTLSPECQSYLQSLEKNYSRWNRLGLQLLAINADEFAVSTDNRNSQQASLDAFLAKSRLSFPILRGSADILAVYNILYRQLFDRHRDLSLPTSFLIDAADNMVKVYQGPVAPERIEQDVPRIPKSDVERLQRALPFAVAQGTFEFGRNHLSLGSIFFQHGYLEPAEASFQQALRDDPSSAEALYGIGSVYLNQNKNDAARQTLERCVKLHASYPDTLPDAWNNLGVLDTRDNRIADSVAKFQQALKLNPNHLLSLVNLGNAYRAEKNWDAAQKVLQLAVEISPGDPEANYALAMVFAQENDSASAYEHLQRALKARPNYPEALNNLGVLYLRTDRRDDAVATFEHCIQVAPAFDQAYLNLARVYALEGTRDQARSVLLELLKQHPDHAQAKQMLDQLE
ncbi:MAG TPA: FG-GAP-like repeat-containing protein [Candidatus Sulfotelmatobacter sp.]|nr:FG-GAP-like repeat-containing protein [Candidatus Sulfotelmatobacter sp.]